MNLDFSDFSFDQPILEGISAMGFDEPTPIQERAIPVILKGDDLIGCAQTGTGKTAAFILPLLQLLLKKPDHKGTFSLILVPTRELALQIDQQLQGFAYYLPFSSAPVYGGGAGDVWEKQKKAVQSGVDIIVATPGRLISLLILGHLKPDNLKVLVLDEADRMLDMGFYDDIMQIIDFLPRKRQTLLFSATMPPKIRQMAKKVLKSPAEINIGLAKPPEKVLQGAYYVDDSQKRELVRELLNGKQDIKSILIFSSTKKNVKVLYNGLKSDGFTVNAMHSDLEQKEREEVINDFKNRKFQILIATDIVSRGIDIENIDLIINYDVPHDAEDYVHRVGRTARAKNSGVALTFINHEERRKFRNIERFIGSEVYKIPLPGNISEGEKKEKVPEKKRGRGRPRKNPA